MLYQPDSLKWKDAGKRAEAAGLSARLLSFQGGEHLCCESWRVARPDTGTLRNVYILWTAEGITSVVCECRTREQNEHDCACCHAAAAVEASFDLAIQDAWQDDDGGLVTVVTPSNGPGYAVPTQRIESL